MKEGVLKYSTFLRGHMCRKLNSFSKNRRIRRNCKKNHGVILYFLFVRKITNLNFDIFHKKNPSQNGFPFMSNHFFQPNDQGSVFPCYNS